MNEQGDMEAKARKRAAQMREATRRYYARSIGQDVPLLKTGPKLGSRFGPPQHGTQTEYGRYGCRCEPCREAAREHAARYPCDPAKNLAAVRRNQEKRFARVRAIKERPCADCGIQYPSYVMQFDHLGEKEFGISYAVRRVSTARIDAEIAKCEIVCAN